MRKHSKFLPLWAFVWALWCFGDVGPLPATLELLELTNKLTRALEEVPACWLVPLLSIWPFTAAVVDFEERDSSGKIHPLFSFIFYTINTSFYTSQSMLSAKLNMRMGLHSPTNLHACAQSQNFQGLYILEDICVRVNLSLLLQTLQISILWILKNSKTKSFF